MRTLRAHSNGFRHVRDTYPRVVISAYDRDIERARRDSNEQVARTVAEWERPRGIEPHNWGRHRHS